MDLYRVVRACDDTMPSVPAEARGDYITGRDYEKLAAIGFDGTPAVYHCARLTGMEIDEVGNKASEWDRNKAAFVRGLMKVTHLRRDPDDDATERYDWTRPDDRSGKRRPIPQTELDQHFDAAAIQEIGSVIWGRAFLARTSGGFFLLPAICQVALTARWHRRAVQMSASLSSAANKPPVAPAPSTASPALTPSPDSAPTTDVTATG